jgi:WhiB family redox-sensing transcriptional regulator
MIEYASNWRAASACLNADPDMFFPVAAGNAASKEVSLALRLCQGCTVRQHCLDFAMQSGEKEGIWGGTTPEERIRARRARNRRPGARAWQQAPESRAS